MIDWDIVVGGALCVGLPIALVVGVVWRRYAWRRLAESLRWTIVPEERTEDMKVDPIEGSYRGRSAYVFVRQGAGERSETVALVALPESMNLGLCGAAETWQTRSDNAFSRWQSVTSVTGLVGHVVRAFKTSEVDEMFPLWPTDARVAKAYTFTACEQEAANRLIDSEAVTEALLRARRPRWSVYVDDVAVLVSPGVGTIANPRRIRAALMEAGNLGEALVSAHEAEGMTAVEHGADYEESSRS